ncbi:MAG: aspartate/glutamate racemase family protein [Anaerovoracaceae bacterium]|jgi:aspartate racemase
MENAFGIIGGMGPMATDLFYKMLIEKTDASCDQDHLNTIILGHATMPDRTGAILSGDPAQMDRVKQLLLEDARTLENLGCKAIGVPCNTAHFFIDQIRDQIRIPFIHMVKETVRTASESTHGGKIGILATDGTIHTHLYQDALTAAGADPFLISEEGQKRVMHEIYDCVKAGKPSDRETWNEIDRELKTAGCDRALLACTELSVLKEELCLSDFYLDPLEVMAERALDFMGKPRIDPSGK